MEKKITKKQHVFVCFIMLLTVAVVSLFFSEAIFEGDFLFSFLLIGGSTLLAFTIIGAIILIGKIYDWLGD